MQSQWRRFQFFDKELLKGEDASSTAPHPELARLQVTCVTSGKGQLMLGDASGVVTLCDRKGALTKFQAFERRVTQLMLIAQQNLLVSVGDDAAATCMLKVWNVDKTDPDGESFELTISKDIFQSVPLPRSPVTALTAADDLSLVVLGLNSGAILLVDPHARGKGGGVRVLTTPHQAPVAGVGLEPQGARNGREEPRSGPSGLMVATTSQLLCFQNLDQARCEVLDEQGCALGAAAYTEEHEMLVGRQEAVYCFHRDGRGATYALEGDKVLLAVMRGYLLVATADLPRPQAPPARGAPLAKVGAAATVTVYDMRNKLVAFSAAVPAVRFATYEWGGIVLVCGDGKVHKLAEKDTAEKLDMLFKRNLYPMAVHLAQSQQLDEAYIVDIQRKYGDHLYAKQDFDGAMAQYLLTVGKLEPSYVIRKFLDAQRIHNLTLYLQALHERGLAHAEQTTLLLNCYTKLKDAAALDKFIRWNGLQYDPDTAINTLCSAGYLGHALHLAREHRRHLLAVDILVQQQHDYEGAVGYMTELPPTDALACVRSVGAHVMPHEPAALTKLLKSLCTGPASAPPALQANAGPRPHKGTETDVTRKSEAASRGEGGSRAVRGAGEGRGITRIRRNPMARVLPAEGGSAADEGREGRGSSGEPGPRGAGAESECAGADSATAMAMGLVHIFAGEAERPYLVAFLEHLASHDDAAPPGVYNTLLELYVAEWAARRSQSDSAGAGEWESKALALIQQSRARLDSDAALAACRLREFDAGLERLLERQGPGAHRHLLEHHAARGNVEGVMQTCERLGTLEPQLWVEALHFLAAQEELPRSEVTRVLERIEEGRLLPPLVVVQVLAQHPGATLELVKGLMTRSLAAEARRIKEDRGVVKVLAVETARMRQEMETLRTQARVVQGRDCSACGQPLDLPTVHFMCQHEGTPCSFHQRCLASDKDKECPLCGPEAARVRAIAASSARAQTAEVQESFFRELEAAEANGAGGLAGAAASRFSTIADYFSKSLI